MQKRVVSYLILVFVLIASNFQLYSQLQRPRELRRGHVSDEEIVSMTKTLPINKALDIFNEISKKFLKKVIIDPEGRTFPIGINIDKMHWMDAMELILKTNNLWYEEYEDYIKIIPLSEVTGQTGEKQGEKQVSFTTREVVISAVFFEVNESKLRQAGMSWNFLRGRDVNLSASMTSADAKSGLFQVDFNPDWDFADIMTVFKSLESDQIGEIIANPQVTVRSGEEGRIQVFSTGTIIRVTPNVMSKDSIYFTDLNLQVERSSTAGGDRLEIQKSTAETKILLLDGEETVIGGLYTKEGNNSRAGIPFLKDLPWWFFGLRYVFGFESKSVIKKELLMLLKADLLPTLEERFAQKLHRESNRDLLREKSVELRKRLRDYQRQFDKGK